MNCQLTATASVGRAVNSFPSHGKFPKIPQIAREFRLKEEPEQTSTERLSE